MLTIEEIKKALDSGKEVELECIDQEAYWKNTFRPDHYNSFLLSGRIVVRGIDKFGVDIIGSQIAINSKDLKYFSIKRPTPTFDDMIDVAVKAFKDGVLEKVNVNDFGVRELRYKLKDEDSDCIVFEQHDDYSDGVDFINSLYTETFVIECEEDTRRVKQYATIEFQNGNKVVMDNPPCDSGIVRIWNDGRYDFTVLKGATVTQKRGAL